MTHRAPATHPIAQVALKIQSQCLNLSGHTSIAPPLSDRGSRAKDVSSDLYSGWGGVGRCHIRPFPLGGISKWVPSL